VDYSVENLYGFLFRSKLLPPDEVRSIYQRWQAEAGPTATQTAPFLRWLVSRQHLTEYQANLLSKGQVDHFFLNEYKVLERIGRGRMAGVYRAVHTLGQVVAIKVLPPSRAKNSQLLARFQREARLSLRLRHANIVRCFQVGKSRDLNYLVMELLEGETLEDVLQRRGRLGVEEAVRLIHQALLGLQHIHEQNMVHRDLKPANLMLVPATVDGTTEHAAVKILDIGLARELYDEDNPAPPDEQLTADGVLLGTPDYMAPEQARDPRSSDIRADIYSLGCLLYQLLSGQVPFPDKNMLRQLVRHANEKPRPLRELNPEVPEGLEQIVEWMMAKKPEARYGTPVRAAQALEVFLLAGNEPAPAEDAPQMRRYLTWLETESLADEPLPAGVAEALAPPVAAPVVAAVALPATADLAAPVALPVVAESPPAVAIALPAPPAPPMQPPAEKKGKPAAKAKVALGTMHALPAVPAESGKPWDRVRQLSRRDWTLLGIGAGAGMLTCAGGALLIWFLRWVFTPRD
jgi:serine/threonine protein kinase